MNKPHLCWCFTLNNPTEQEREFFRTCEVKECVIGDEVGTEGTPHLQGYVTWKKNTRLSALKKLSPRAHWEPTIAKEAAANYCRKEKVFREVIATKKRKLSDIVHEELLSGKKPRQIMQEHSECVFMASSIQKAFNIMREPTVWQVPEVHWIYGPTGTGKTHSVYEREPDLSVITILNGPFFQGYDPTLPATLFDDLRPNDIPYQYLLRITDKYKGVILNVKNGSEEWTPHRIYITSNAHPNDFAPTQEDSGQLTRRMTSITYKKDIPFKF